MARGSCLCGTLQYEVGGPFRMMVNCHCSMCRKHHGAGFATFVSAPFESFKWISGENDVVHYQSSEQGVRPFCRVCGSVAPTLAPTLELAIIPAGNLDGDLGVAPELHMFVGSKPQWTSISDSLPQYDSWPPSFEGQAIDRPARETKPDAVTGSCLCGDVAYEYTGSPVRMWSCHCSRCRHARSAAHGTNVFVTLEQFRWTRGESQVASYKVPDARFFTQSFCTRCGSAMPVYSVARGLAIIPLGSLDSEPGMRPMAHVFTGSKSPWFKISDLTPQHIEAPPVPSSPLRAT